MKDTPLDAACSVCYTHVYKYRCPRCPSVRTCSLPCYKRHQQRSSCTGERNPTGFLRKSQVTTPTVIDHDFNFLTKIESAVRTGTLRDQRQERPSKRRKLGSNPAFNSYLVQNNIMISKAPSALHRSKVNDSRYLPRSKKVSWTVEWVDEDGEKRLSQAVEDMSLNEAWECMMTSGLKRSQKRKRRAERSDIISSRTMSLSVAGPGVDDDGAGDASEEEAENEGLAHESGDENDDQTTSAGEKSEAAQDGIQPTRKIEQLKNCQSCQGRTHMIPEPQRAFYLLKPQTASRSRVLIPLEPTSTITRALRDRTIVEFPTIYHLPAAASALPPTFILESQYIEKVPRDRLGRSSSSNVKAVEPAPGVTLMMETLQDSSDAEEGEVIEDETLNQRRILEMLRRDVKA